MEAKEYVFFFSFLFLNNCTICLLFGYNKTTNGLQPEVAFGAASIKFLISFSFWWSIWIMGNMGTRYTREMNAHTQTKNASKPLRLVVLSKMACGDADRANIAK